MPRDLVFSPRAREQLSALYLWIAESSGHHADSCSAIFARTSSMSNASTASITC